MEQLQRRGLQQGAKDREEKQKNFNWHCVALKFIYCF